MKNSKQPALLLIALAWVGLGACGDEGVTGLAPVSPDAVDDASDLDAGDVGDTGAYPDPSAWPPNAGPGGPSVSFSPDALFENCAFIGGGERDRVQHHNLLVMYEGYLLLPWAPEYGQGGLAFYDFSDPCQPVLVGDGWAQTMRETHAIGFSSIGGRWAVVNQIKTLREGGIQFWDVSDPTAPEAVMDLPLEGFFYPDAYARVVLSVFWQAPYVYVAQADLGVVIVDARDPMAPEVLGRHTFEPVLRAGQIHAVGNILIVTAAEGARVALLDISDPARPRPIPGGDFLITDDAGEPVEAYFSNIGGGYTYHARKEGGGGVIVYDIRDPTNPTKAGALRSEGNGGYVFVKDEMAFVGESNFAALYDLHDLDDITEVGRFDLKGDLDTMTPIGNVAVLSVDDKASPRQGSAVAPWRTEPDTEPPHVTWAWPAAGAEDLAVTSRFGVTFNEMVDVRSAWEGSVRLYDTELGPEEGRVDGHISVQENVVNFWPVAPLEHLRRYTLELPAGGVVDYNGNAITQAHTATFTTRSPLLIEADAGPSGTHTLGASVSLDGSGSIGPVVSWIWDPGDGSGPMAPSESSQVEVIYDAPGRYRASLTVRNEAGDESHDEALITVVEPPTFAPNASGPVQLGPEGARIAVVSQDAGLITVAKVRANGFKDAVRVPVCEDPRTVAWLTPDRLVVACQWDDQIAVVDIDGDEGSAQLTAMPYGSAPYGIIEVDGAMWVSFQGHGELARLEIVDDALSLTRRIEATPDARGVSLLPDGRIAVTRWRSPDTGGEVAVVTLEDGSVTRWILPFADIPADSDTETGGVPTWLNQIALSPDGRIAAIPALQANIGVGAFVNGTGLSHETTLRGVVSYLDPTTGTPVRSRKQFDDRGFASAAAYNAFGDFLYVVTRGSRAVERLDRFNGAQAGTILDVGFAPSALVTAPDGQWIAVDVPLSRQLRLYDVVREPLPVLIDTLATVEEEPLSAELLLGAQLFNDAFDPRLAQDSYIACANCHLEGSADNLTWDFTDRGEGLRNTISLLGRAGTGHGPLHWSANFDEVQDFEHDIRGPFSGLGLMSDDDFHAEGRDTPMGAPKAGVSADLDALAAYVTSLDRHPRSPYRGESGELREAALRGEVIFGDEDLGCITCHAGDHLTDSALLGPGDPRLHDVGTLGEASGQRLGGELPGIDTPTLHGLWANPPYLHDGSAATLREVLTTAAPGSVHDVRESLSEDQIDDLVLFLLSLDGPS